MKNSSTNPDPTIPKSLDYLIELSDDGKQPEQPEAEIIVIPPVTPAADGSPTPPIQRQQKPQT